MSEYSEILKQIESAKIPRREKRRLLIQATEGQVRTSTLDSLYWPSFSNNSKIGGACNLYKTYSEQTKAIYDKYNAKSDFGAQLTRSVIDIRTGFICAEGLNISAPGDPAFQNWIYNFLKINNLSGSGLVRLVKGLEMRGRELLTIRPRPGIVPAVKRVIGQEYMCAGDPSAYNLNQLIFQNNEEKTPQNPNNFVLILTGGDGIDLNNPTTKTGAVLNDIDNYDRAKKDLRINNHISARITPNIETETDAETSGVLKQIAAQGWRIGDVFVGKKLRYETPGRGAADNLREEIDTSILTVSGTTGIPVHWLGHTTLMSNRATASDLYGSLLTATAAERLAIEEAFYNLILKAQKIYIETGGEEIKVVSSDFEVKLPAVDYASFESRVKALSLAYADRAISIEDYRNQIPGIDPLRTAQVVAKEEAF